nr:MAG: ATPase/GTPase, AAA15 family [Candidatus Kentron sp. MB]
MQLKSLEYTELEGTPIEWTLRGFTPGDANLLVGKNASGKSSVLNVIHNMALMIAGQRPPFFNAHISSLIFEDDGLETEYSSRTHGGKVIAERFMIDGEIKLDRGHGGKGKIYAEKEGKAIEFQTPENQLAVVARRDTLQHPFFEPLHQWAASLYYYQFGTSLGKESLFLFSDDNLQLNPKDPSQVVGIFHKGDKEFGERFRNAVLADFEPVGYPVDKIGLVVPRYYVTIQMPMADKLVGIYVKETDLPGITEQNEMSQGMFRALSVIIQLNYAILADTPSCILIDDIGEGLDFERSCNLIDVLMRKVEGSPVQLMMTTNDRFVMNHVPLEAWSVVDRDRNRVTIRNYANAREIFDRFKFTGLNNFDFLALDYLHTSTTDE